MNESISDHVQRVAEHSYQIMEIIETGGLRRIAFENTEDVEAVKTFTGIYGVGKSRVPGMILTTD